MKCYEKGILVTACAELVRSLKESKKLSPLI